MFQDYKEIDIDWLKKHHTKIHFFGLGFIQVKIDEAYRLHFYSPELESFVDSPHNHRYDFESTILKGEIRNKIYKPIDGSSHYVQEDACQEGYIPKESPKLKSFHLVSDKTYRQGEKYYMKHEVFHVVEANECITLLKRSEYKKDLAEVSYEANKGKECPFSKVIAENDLWDIIERLLNK